jgi:hypothetical protein
MEEVEQVVILVFCIPLMQVPTVHVMTENTLTITGVPDNRTVPNIQFNVQFGLQNQIISRHKPICAVDQPNISNLNAKHTKSVNTNNTHITFLLPHKLSLNLLNRSRNVIEYDHRNHGYNMI